MLRKTGGKSQADLAVNLNLADAGLLIFDGIFDGDDLGGVVLDFVECRIERRAFTGTGRPGDEDDAVRPIDQFAEGFVGIGQACRRWRD